MPCCRRYGSTHALSSSSPPTCAGVLCPTSATRLPSAAMHRRDRWQHRTGNPVVVYQPWRATLRSGTEQQPAINGRCSLTPKGSRLSVLAPAQTDNLNIYQQKTILYLKKSIAFPVWKVCTFSSQKYILLTHESIYFHHSGVYTFVSESIYFFYREYYLYIRGSDIGRVQKHVIQYPDF